MKDINYKSITLGPFMKLKKRFLIVKSILEKRKDLSDTQRADLINAISLDGELPSALKESQASWAKLNPFHYVRALASKINLHSGSNDEKALDEYSRVNELDDVKFLRLLHDVMMEEPPIFATSVTELRQLALQGIRQMLETSAKAVTEKMILAQEAEVRDAARSHAKMHIEQAKYEAASILRKAIETKLFGEGKQ